jgi:hypothetical protein
MSHGASTPYPTTTRLQSPLAAERRVHDRTRRPGAREAHALQLPQQRQQLAGARLVRDTATRDTLTLPRDLTHSDAPDDTPRQRLPVLRDVCRQLPIAVTHASAAHVSRTCAGGTSGSASTIAAPGAAPGCEAGVVARSSRDSVTGGRALRTDVSGSYVTTRNHDAPSTSYRDAIDGNLAPVYHLLDAHHLCARAITHSLTAHVTAPECSAVSAPAAAPARRR